MAFIVEMESMAADLAGSLHFFKKRSAGHGSRNFLYSLEISVERYYRDSKLYQVGEGTANLMKLLIANDASGIKKANCSRIFRENIHSHMGYVLKSLLC